MKILLFSGLLLEIFAAFTAALSFFCVGTIRAWTSPGIYSMEQDLQDGITLEPSDVTWIASCIPIGAFFGTMAGAPLLQNFGRQKTLFVLPLAYIAGWLLISFALNVYMIFVGRALTGFAVGLSTATAQLYVSECSRVSLRGVLGLMPAMMLAVGIVCGFSLGTWINWRISSLVLTAFPITLFLFASILPESPMWLLMNGREKDARKSMERLRGFHQDERVEREMTEIKTCLKENSTELRLWDLLKKQEIWHPLLLVLMLMMFQQLSGISAILYYLKLLLKESKVHSDKINLSLPLDANYSILIFGLTHVMAFFISLPLIERGGRKILLVISASFMCASQVALGLYFFFGSLNHVDLIAKTGAWLPLTSLCFFIAAYSIGFASVPYIIMAEIFPSRIRSYLCSITALSEQVFCFTIVRVFPPLMLAIEPFLIFWIFSVFCLLAIAFVVFFVPETKGKSLCELEKLFKKSPEVSNVHPADYITVGLY